MTTCTLPNKRMLIVDDDKRLAQSLYRSLRRKFDIQIALSGDIAIDAIRDNKPFDVILCDWMMPGLDGVDFMERARFMSPYAVNILMTGHSDDPFEKRPEAKQYFRSLVRKPCTPTDIWQIVDNASETVEV